MAVEFSSGLGASVPTVEVSTGNGAIRRRPAEEGAHLSLAGPLQLRTYETHQQTEAQQHHVFQVNRSPSFSWTNCVFLAPMRMNRVAWSTWSTESTVSQGTRRLEIFRSLCMTINSSKWAIRVIIGKTLNGTGWYGRNEGCSVSSSLSGSSDGRQRFWE